MILLTRRLFKLKKAKVMKKRLKIMKKRLKKIKNRIINKGKMHNPQKKMNK